jgi:hypothetical protein
MKAARKLLERWGALIYVDTLGYQWQAGLYDAIQDVRLGFPITELPTDTDTFASAKALAEAELK